MTLHNKILIADDDEDFRLKMRGLLSLKGFDVLTAGNGEEALAMIKTVEPDLLILDLMMPEMDGASVTHDLSTRVSGKKIPIIIISGLCLNMPEQQLVDSSENVKFLRKPFEIDEILELISGLLKG